MEAAQPGASQLMRVPPSARCSTVIGASVHVEKTPRGCLSRGVYAFPGGAAPLCARNAGTGELRGAVMAKRAVPKPPAGLKAQGKALWSSIVNDIDEGWELDSRDLALLREAALIADQLADLDAVLKRDGMTIAGSRGQIVVHPALSEARQLRLAALRLLGALELVDPALANRNATHSSRRARKAAEARWGELRDHG